jgi:hypothetical protein
MTAKNRKAFASLDFDMEFGGPLSFSDRDSGPEDEEEPRPTLLRRTTIGNGKHTFNFLLIFCNGYTRELKYTISFSRPS